LLTSKLRDLADSCEISLPCLACNSTRAGKGARPTQLAYPDGRIVKLRYGTSGSAADRLARVDAITDNGGSLIYVSYQYLGLGTFVPADYEQPDVRLDYTAAAGGEAKYPGFDRFGRVVDHRWYFYGGGSPVDRDRYQYGYDRNSNRTFRDNLVAESLGKPFDERYAYDNVNRLTSWSRGSFAPGGEITAVQRWLLDPTGNWRFTSGTMPDGTALNQARTHDRSNQMTSLQGWFPPKYDTAGNMTEFPRPAAPTEGFRAVYDPWNRMVRIASVSESSGSSPDPTL
jgi:hypothetical protein